MSRDAKNILIDIRLLSKGGTSGIEEYTRNLVQNILTLDQTNRYTLFYNGFRKRPIAEVLPDVPPNLVATSRIPNKILDFTAHFFGQPIFKAVRESDLVFSPHFNIIETEKKPRIITFHDLSFLHHPYFFSWRKNFWHWLQNYRSAADQAARIIAVSEFTKRDLVSLLNVPPEKITVISLGLDDSYRHLPQNDITAFRKEKNMPFPFILHLGTLEPRKNALAVIHAFSILKSQKKYHDLHLILAGAAGWLYQKIIRAAHTSPYAKHIHFWGKISQEEKIKLYNAAEVFVYPSFFEGFGLPPLEAQACGIPVVVSDRTSLPEVLGDSAVFIDPWKVAELAEAIAQIINNSATRQTLIKKGAENIKRFSWRETAEKTINVFNSI